MIKLIDILEEVKKILDFGQIFELKENAEKNQQKKVAKRLKKP